ncbi:pyrimidine-nucleoside phosphorylase [Desulfovirgula thermocuniculi]|uniref:pyrimidine-nucleoside phosphorylase n=1 Tax=Desulfovirgula thermocuniculi TaxID=348842 RepID=UPI00040B7A73|nr:pyrimidine-nucleoside phosphorylase [Desulfovirgula thermocuniculi]
MRAYDIILKKRQGQELSREEIEFFVRGYAGGEIPDYQAAAFLMAVYFRGLSFRETADLTMAMVASGETVDLSSIPGRKVDKHSTGGVGDKTTLVLAPLVAAAGVPVAKMSGRGLGHTGGTIDKLESIPGLRVSLTPQEFISQVRKIGLAVVAQSGNLVPADKKLYALRDVTATVDSVPLIASSVMSKKIAAGAEAIVLDVKVGDGAFMRTMEEARSLATTMVAIGRLVGRQTTAVISDMDQPLGFAVGNALEVREAIEALAGNGPADLVELCLVLGGHMLFLAGAAATPGEGAGRLEEVLRSGRALEKFKEMVREQGGDPKTVEEPDRLPLARHREVVVARGEGYVCAVKAKKIGRAAMLLGAGREKKEDSIDHGVGVVLHKKSGDYVKSGEALATLYASDAARIPPARREVEEAFALGVEKPPASNLIREVIG